MKIERFLICKNPLIDGACTYILCTRPIVLVKLPGFEVVIGDPDEGLIGRMKDWYLTVNKKENEGNK